MDTTPPSPSLRPKMCDLQLSTRVLWPLVNDSSFLPFFSRRYYFFPHEIRLNLPTDHPYLYNLITNNNHIGLLQCTMHIYSKLVAVYAK